MSSENTQDLDRALGFTIAERHARGRLARLGPVLDTILTAHAYPPAIEKLLAEARLERDRMMQEATQMANQFRETEKARATAEAERVSQAAAAEAEASAGRRERMAMDRIAAAESSAIAEVRGVAAEVATAAARALIAETFTADDDAAMIDAAVADLPRALRAA